MMMPIASAAYLALFTLAVSAIVVILGNELFMRLRSRRKS